MHILYIYIISTKSHQSAADAVVSVLLLAFFEKTIYIYVNYYIIILLHVLGLIIYIALMNV